MSRAMELTTDSDLALAMSMAYNDSESSQDDDFQKPSWSTQSLVHKRITGSRQSKRQKDSLTMKKQTQIKRSKENSSKRGAKVSKSKNGLDASRWPLVDKDPNCVTTIRKRHPKTGLDELISSKRCVPSIDQVSNNGSVKNVCLLSKQSVDSAITFASICAEVLHLPEISAQKIESVDAGLIDSGEVSNKEVVRNVASYSGKVLVNADNCSSDGGQETVLVNTDETSINNGMLTISHSISCQYNEDVVSLAEDNEVMEPITSQRSQCVISMKHQVDPISTKQSHSLQAESDLNEILEATQSNSTLTNPDSQFNALLHLCVDSTPLNADTAEEAMISMMTQGEAFLNSHAQDSTEQRFSPLTDMDAKVIAVDGEGNITGDILIEEPEAALYCPVCGSCITGLSIERRELHTNACLDSIEKTDPPMNINSEEIINDETQKKAPANENEVENQLRNEACESVEMVSSFDIAPVLKWLETLNLSRYAEIFIREEIDWDTIRCLTDEDLFTLGITALGPRKKILYSLKQLEQEDRRVSEHPVATNLTERKRITDFFSLPGNVQKRPLPDTSSKESTNRDKETSAIRRRISAQLGGIPEWMCVPGTKFRVDAFQHLRGDCSHWFLTHFHTDHYQGLTRGFRYGHVYCSPVTAKLVNSRIGVPWDRIKILPLHETVDVDGVKVTFLDANHCPGSVMILFEPQNGKAVLHTGDFRFCEDMAHNATLQASNIHTLILDTTYCNPQYDFPKQDTVVQFIIDAIQAEAFNPNTLFLIGTYTVGKERIFFEVAKVLQKKIYVNATKLRLLQCMEFPKEDMKWLTTNELESHIHVVPLWSIASFKRMNYISRQTRGRYNSIVSFSPTGWSYGRGKKRTPSRRWQQGTIIRYEVPYSEHSSFMELRDFVKFIGPVNIIPSVHNESAESADALVALLLNDEVDQAH